MNTSRPSESSQKPYDPSLPIYNRDNLVFMLENWADYDNDTQKQICATLCELADDKDLGIFDEMMENLAAIAYVASNEHFIREKSAQFSKNVFQTYLDKHDRYTFKAFFSRFPISNFSTTQRSTNILTRSAAVKSELVLSAASQNLLSLMKRVAPDSDCENRFASQAMLTLIVPIITSDIEDSVKLPEIAQTYANLHPELNDWRNDLAGLFTKYSKRFIVNHRDDAKSVTAILTSTQDIMVQFNNLTKLYNNALKAPLTYKVTDKFIGYLSFALIALADNLKLDLAPQLAVFMQADISHKFMETNIKDTNTEKLKGEFQTAETRSIPSTSPEQDPVAHAASKPSRKISPPTLVHKPLPGEHDLSYVTTTRGSAMFDVGDLCDFTKIADDGSLSIRSASNGA
jgi:hypothetical protein